MRRHSHRGNRHDFSRGFEGMKCKKESAIQRYTHHLIFYFIAYFSAEVSAEELFNMFFGGSFGGPNVYVRRGRQWERQRTENANQVTIQQLLFPSQNLFHSIFFFFFYCSRDLLELDCCYNSCPF